MVILRKKQAPFQTTLAQCERRRWHGRQLDEHSLFTGRAASGRGLTHDICRGGAFETQEDPTTPASPTVVVGLETLDAFFSEMELLYGKVNTGNGPTASSQCQENAPPSIHLSLMDSVSAAQATIATSKHSLKTKPEAKKLSSLERTQKQKAMAQQEIWVMVQQIKRIRRERDDKLGLIYTKHWKPIIQHEVHRKEIVNAQQLRL